MKPCGRWRAARPPWKAVPLKREFHLITCTSSDVNVHLFNIKNKKKRDKFVLFVLTLFYKRSLKQLLFRQLQQNAGGFTHREHVSMLADTSILLLTGGLVKDLNVVSLLFLFLFCSLCCFNCLERLHAVGSSLVHILISFISPAFIRWLYRFGFCLFTLLKHEAYCI